MSIEFNRRTFLKTGAALVGATALMGLTGCGDSSSSAPAVNKKVDITKDNVFNLGSLKVSPLSASSGTLTDPSRSFNYIITNESGADVTLYSDSFSAFYKGNALRLISVDGLAPAANQVTLTKDAKNVIVEPFFAFAAPTDFDSENDIVFKFHYGNKSIKFQSKNNGQDLYTSGVYTDEVKL